MTSTSLGPFVAESLPCSLAGDNQRPLGAVSCEGVPPRAGGTASTVSTSSFGSPLASSAAAHREGNWGTPPEEGGGAYVSIRGAVIEQDFLGTQEGRFLPSCVRSASSERLYRELPFQDGGTTNSKGAVTEGRLAMHNGPEGCLSLSGCGSGAQEVPSVCVGREDPPIYLSSFQSFQCSKGIHKAPLDSDGIVALSGPQVRDLPGRSAADVSSERPPEMKGAGNSLPVRELGILHQPGQIPTISSTGTAVPRVCGRLPGNVTAVTSGQTVPSNRELQDYVTTRSPVSKRPGYWVC